MYFLANTYHGKDKKLTIHIEREIIISEEEREDLMSFFAFTSYIVVMKTMRSITLKNSKAFTDHLNPVNLMKYSPRNLYDAVVIANQHVFNYAASIKSFIEYGAKQLKKTKGNDALKNFKQTQKHLSDAHFEYTRLDGLARLCYTLWIPVSWLSCNRRRG